MIMTPEKMPAPPRPAIALPIMNAIEFGAPPLRAAPTSKINVLTRNVLCRDT